MLQTARPLFCHIGVMNSGELRGPSTFVLQFEQRYAVVTADHVNAPIYRSAYGRPEDSLSNWSMPSLAEHSLIARSVRREIAVFAVDGHQLKVMGAVPFDYRRHWPPPDVAVGDMLTLAGYPNTRRTRISHGH